MTPLKPIENLRVLAAKSERYPSNTICSHPECTEAVADQHHTFPRSQIEGDSYFVIIADEDGAYTAEPIPHVTGLCRAHHNDVEEHRAWIKLEEGTFNWYAQHKSQLIACACMGTCKQPPHFTCSGEARPEPWDFLGPLNPQPGSVEGKPKKKKKSAEEKRKRKTISLRVPADSEDGAAVYDEYLDRVKERLVVEGLYVTVEKIPAYEATIAAWDDWLNS